jgi:CRISPR-associated protein Csx17
MSDLDVAVAGLPPTPIGNYLAALGVLRAVARQHPGALGWWAVGEVFHVESAFGEKELVNYFLDQYSPTPFVRPWEPDPKEDQQVLESLPDGDRWETLRRALRFSSGLVDISLKGKDAVKKMKARRGELERLGGTKKDQRKREQEDATCQALRREIAEADAALDKNTLERTVPASLLPLFRASFVLFETEEKPRYGPLLGSGGNDGNRDFAVMYLQCIRQALLGDRDTSRRLLELTLFGRPLDGLAIEVPEFSGGSWFPSAVKLFNSGQKGFFSKGRISPWTYIFAAEGVLTFSGGASRRLGSKARPEAVFPFTTGPPALTADAKRVGVEAKRDAEVWTPLWPKRARFDELAFVLKNGRASVHSRAATAPADYAQAALGQQVNRGFSHFERHALEHLTSKNTFEVVPLGRFEVGSARAEAARLLAELRPWVDKLPYDNANAKRICGHRRRIEDAILAACQQPSAERLLGVLRAAADIDARIDRNRDDRLACRPVPPLSLRWLSICIDERSGPSPELVLAASLASLRANSEWEETWAGESPLGVPSLRGNLFAIRLFEPLRSGRRGVAAFLPTRHGRVAWSRLNPMRDLAAVLRRRYLDSGLSLPPALRGSYACPPDVLAAFVAGRIDVARVAGLVPAFSLLNWSDLDRADRHPGDFRLPSSSDPAAQRTSAALREVDPAFLTLKLLFQPYNFALGDRTGKVFGDRVCPPRAPEVLACLLAGDIARALRLARVRLRACGLMPVEFNESGHNADRVARIAAGLLVPVSVGFLRLALRRVTVPSLRQRSA